jgi:hypothetical protein
MNSELDKFYELIDQIKIAMMTTRPVVLFELAKGWLTGERVEPGQTHALQQPHR